MIASATDSNGENRHRAPARPKFSPAPVRGIRRPEGLPHATRNIQIPAPEHKHLPAWVKKVHRDAEPIFKDILGALEGEKRQEIQQKLQALVDAISGGRFSQAFRYPELVSEGGRLVTDHRQANQATERARRSLEFGRKRIADTLRQEQSRLGAEVYARLSRAAKQADSAEAVATVQRDVDSAVASAKSLENRRRDREIDRTRERMLKSLPQRAQSAPQNEETWQDVLKRLAGAVESE